MSSSSAARLADDEARIEQLEEVVRKLRAAIASFGPQIPGRVIEKESELQSALSFVKTQLGRAKQGVASRIYLREWQKGLMKKMGPASHRLIAKLDGTRTQVMDELAFIFGEDKVTRVFRQMVRWVGEKGWALSYPCLETIEEDEEGAEEDVD